MAAEAQPTSGPLLLPLLCIPAADPHWVPHLFIMPQDGGMPGLPDDGVTSRS